MINIKCKTHSVGGLFLGTLSIGLFFNYIISNFNIINILILLIIYIYFLHIGSLFPDIDMPHSYLGRRFSIISNNIHSKFGHRTFTHSLLFIYILLFLSILLDIFLKIFYSNIYTSIYIYIFTTELGFILGCISHILLDMFNPSGVCLLYPYDKRYRLPISPIVKYSGSDEIKLKNYLNFLTFLLVIIYLASLIIRFI